MEEEFLEYLVCASEKLLLEYGRTADESDVRKLRDLVMVRLRAQYLNDLRRMPYCASLKICDLSCNFLTNIDPLEYCINLIKLDLHSNQLEVLPGPVFWGNMKNLKLLYLHDNGISTLENVHSLSFCPNLIALTLFNTPLCLKIAYRHIVVNSIFSLKALDYYVISDEEITEGWRLPEKYKPFTLDFFVDFCPLSGKDTTFQEEMKTVRNIISKINQVLVHHSPILIIQRWIRGHLIRKTLCLSPVCEVLRYNRYIRGGKKQHVASMSSSVSDSVKLEQHTKLKKGTPGIQIIDMNNLKEFHLTLRRLRHPVISTMLKLEEKKKIKQKKSRSTGKDFIEGEKTEMESKEMATTFRLSGSKMPFYSLNEQLKIYEERQKDFFDIVHDMRNITYPIPQTLPMHDPGSIERRIFAKAYGTVRLHPLHAIEKAYWESQKLDLQAKKERDVMRMLIAKSEAKEYIRQLHEGKIEHIQKNYEEKKMKVADHFKESKKRKSKLFIKMKKKYNKFLEKKEDNYGGLVVFCIFFGMSYGMVGALQFEVLMAIVGTQKFSSAIGLVLLAEAMAVLIGPPSAGKLLDATHKYMYVFILAGVEVLTSSVVLTLGNVFCIKRPVQTHTKEDNAEREGLNQPPGESKVDSIEVERFLKDEKNGQVVTNPETCV